MLRVVAFGAEADDALAELVAAAKHGDPLAPVTVAVPSTVCGLSVRRRLATRDFGAGGGGFVNVRFLVLARVAELLGAPRLAAAGRQPLNHAVRMQAVRAALLAEPGPLAPVIDHPDTVAAVDATLRDLRRAPAGALTAIATAGPGAAHVVRIATAFRAATTRHWYDDEDLADAAALAVDDGEPALADVGAVVAFLPRRLSPGELRFCAALGRHDRLAAVVGRTGDERADASAARMVTDLSVILGPPGERGGSRTAYATAVVRAGDPDDEVRAALRGVIERIEAGTPLPDIAVLWRAADPYALLVHEQLAAAGIPASGPGVRTLAQTVAGRTLIGVLNLRDRDLDRADVFAWLANAPIMLRAGQRVLVPTTRFEELAREAGVTNGVTQWKLRLDDLARTRRTELTAVDDDERGPRRRRRLERDLRAIDELARFVSELDRRLRSARATTWAALATWAQQLLVRYLGEPGADWPDAELDARQRILAALARLSGLDPVAPGGIDAFRNAVNQEFAVAAGRLGRYGEGVYAGRLADATGMQFATVFIVGAADGALPPPISDDPVVADRIRARGGPAVPLRSERRGEERRDWLAALAAAPERIVTFPTADPRGQRTRLPARWLLEEVAHLAGTSVGADELDEFAAEPWFVDVPSFEAGLRDDANAVGVHERDLSLLLACHRVAGSSGVVEHPLVARDLVATEGFAAQRARRAPRLSRWSGAVERDVFHVRDSWSPTRLQTLARCPFEFFLDSVLGVAETAEPEAVDVVSHLDRGTVVHRCLERFVNERLAHPPAPDEAWSAADHARLQEIATEEFDALEAAGLTGRPLLWRLERDRIAADLERTLVDDDERRAASGTTPDAVELDFAADAGHPAAAIVLANGTPVRFRGRVDRVDRGPGDGVTVIDYKTGKSDDYKRLHDDPVGQGALLQLPVYALGARTHYGADVPVRAVFRFVTTRGGFAEIGYDVDDDKLDSLRGALDVTVGLVQQGAFPARPGSPTQTSFRHCAWCAYDRVCPTDRGARWSATRDDPRLAAFVALTEPDDPQ